MALIAPPKGVRLATAFGENHSTALGSRAEAPKRAVTRALRGKPPYLPGLGASDGDERREHEHARHVDVQVAPEECPREQLADEHVLELGLRPEVEQHLREEDKGGAAQSMSASECVGDAKGDEYRSEGTRQGSGSGLARPVIEGTER